MSAALSRTMCSPVPASTPYQHRWLLYNRYLNDHNVDNMTETGGEARVIWNLSEKNSLDFKARYSKVDAAAISFNAAFAFPNLAGYFGNPDLNQNVNDHKFDYINNIDPITSRTI